MAAVSFSDSVWSKEGIESKILPLYRELELIEKQRTKYTPPFLPNLESRSLLERGIVVLSQQRLEQLNVAYEKTDELFRLYLALYHKHCKSFDSLIQKITSDSSEQHILSVKFNASISFGHADDILEGIQASSES